MEPVEIAWDEPAARAIAARPTTEAGASAIILAAVEHARALFAAVRPDVGSGVDYYLLPDGAAFDDLEDAVRLEVSGVGRGAAAAVRRRLREKTEQALRGDSNLPVIAGVVGFEAKLVLLQGLEVLP